ncbi:hypothetical protein Acr_01g0008300 [Actinidia rufa]|uniref:Uncharacterized protein n=1 Tax=Actinidia rufa TaxID=165716 RepID=A0A7J0E3C8_9ERIC|nr:hypothetical protein Acr_01g0008300 [Actinidia rufa]
MISSRSLSITAIFLTEAGITSSSSSYTSSNSSNNEEDEGEKALIGEVEITHSFREGGVSGTSSSEANMASSQVPLPATTPILAPTAQDGVKLSSSEAPLLDKRKGKQLTKGPSKKSKKNKGETSSAFLPSSSDHAELLKPEFFTTELIKQVTVANFTKDHDTSLALTHTIMLQKDVTNLAEEGSKEIRDLLVMQQVQKQAKLDSEAAEKAKLDLVATIQKRDTSYVAVIESRGIDRASNSYDKKLPELCPSIFQKGWLVCLKELDIPPNYPAWNAAPFEIKPLDPPQVYFSLILPHFNEEEVLEKTVDKVSEKTP